MRLPRFCQAEGLADNDSNLARFNQHRDLIQLFAVGFGHVLGAAYSQRIRRFFIGLAQGDFHPSQYAAFPRG